MVQEIHLWLYVKFFLERKEKSRDRSKGQAVYLLMKERIGQIKREKLPCEFK